MAKTGFLSTTEGHRREQDFRNGEGAGDEYGIMPFYGPGADNMVLIQQPRRYFGLSKELAEPDNEQRLEDAPRVMAFLAPLEPSVISDSHSSSRP